MIINKCTNATVSLIYQEFHISEFLYSQIHKMSRVPKKTNTQKKKPQNFHECKF